MRAIIIEDKDCKALMDKLKLTSMQDERILLTYRKNPDKPVSVEEVHGAFVYVVVQWLQEQGWKA